MQKSGTNVLAIISLIVAFVVPLAGVICGHISLAQIARTGETGRGLAIAGLIIGYLAMALGILLIVLGFLSAALDASSTTTGY